MKVFIGHSKVAQRLGRDLEVAGATIWVDELQLAGGTGILDGVQSGLEASDGLCLLNSRSAATSTWIAHELESYYSGLLSGNRERRVIVLQLDDTPPQAHLAHLLYIDLTDYRRGLAELCHSLGLTSQPPETVTIPGKGRRSLAVVPAVFDSAITSVDLYSELERNVNEDRRVNQNCLYWNVESARR